MLRKSKHTNAMVRGLLLTVLLLALPTFAHAWTLYVQVSNGDASHYVTVGSNTTQLKSGTTSYNVSSTIAANTIKVYGSGGTATLDGAAFNPVTDSIAPPVSPATSRTVSV